MFVSNIPTSETNTLNLLKRLLSGNEVMKQRVHLIENPKPKP